MRQETVTYTLYKFEELNDKAKERARDWYREGLEYGWHDESLQSVQAFCNFLDCKIFVYFCNPTTSEDMSTNTLDSSV